MSWFAFDEQITVAVERTSDGFSPTKVRLFIPGHPGVVGLSGDVRGRTFRSESDAAVAAVEELRSTRPTLFDRWAGREGFL